MTKSRLRRWLYLLSLGQIWTGPEACGLGERAEDGGREGCRTPGGPPQEGLHHGGEGATHHQGQDLRGFFNGLATTYCSKAIFSTPFPKFFCFFEGSIYRNETHIFPSLPLWKLYLFHLCDVSIYSSDFFFLVLSLLAFFTRLTLVSWAFYLYFLFVFFFGFSFHISPLLSFSSSLFYTVPTNDIGR